MIQRRKTYACDGTPRDEDVLQAIEIAQRENCQIMLCWHVKWSGNYSVLVKPDSTLESVKEKIPRVYGI